jgi:hypothetical protein
VINVVLYAGKRNAIVQRFDFLLRIFDVPDSNLGTGAILTEANTGLKLAITPHPALIQFTVH